MASSWRNTAAISVICCICSHWSHGMFDRKMNQAREVRDAELSHDPATISVDGLAGQRQPLGNFRARGARNRHMQHLALAFAQALERAQRLGVAQDRSDHERGNLWA